MNHNTLLLFKNEFWKDKRKIDIIKINGKEYFSKYYDTVLEKDTELSVIEHLTSKGVNAIPDILYSGEKNIIMPYYKGIRIFNFLVVLQKYEKINKDRSKLIKKLILELCAKKQKAIQYELIEWRKKQAYRDIYPIHKIKTSVSILTDCLNLEYNCNDFDGEIIKLFEYWKKNAAVPFRDSTTKNMLLLDDRLFLPNFRDESERDAYLFNAFDNDSIYELLSKPIIDFDFSSCIHDTTPEDDVVSLLYHEKTWNGQTPHSANLIWNDNNIDCYRAAITFIVRFLRFGSRKAAYKLLHAKTAQKRFKYDDPCYYFMHLERFASALYPDIVYEFPLIFKFVKDVYQQQCFETVAVDYFEQSGLCTDEVPYVDIFPN